MVQKLVVDDTQVKLEIWDTAGQERYRSLAPMYYRGASAAIVVYDITKKDSVETMKKWAEELKKQADPNIIIAIAGNKLDIESQREIQQRDVERFAQTLYDENEIDASEKRNNVVFLECSAKTGQNVEALFIGNTLAYSLSVCSVCSVCSACSVLMYICRDLPQTYRAHCKMKNPQKRKKLNRLPLKKLFISLSFALSAARPFACKAQATCSHQPL
jgi:small GTP-binding protein